MTEKHCAQCIHAFVCRIWTLLIGDCGFMGITDGFCIAKQCKLYIEMEVSE